MNTYLIYCWTGYVRQACVLLSLLFSQSYLEVFERPQIEIDETTYFPRRWGLLTDSRGDPGKREAEAYLCLFWSKQQLTIS